MTTNKVLSAKCTKNLVILTFHKNNLQHKVASRNTSHANENRTLKAAVKKTHPHSTYGKRAIDNQGCYGHGVLSRLVSLVP